jgi:hypothetical protein
MVYHDGGELQSEKRNDTHRLGFRTGGATGHNQECSQQDNAIKTESATLIMNEQTTKYGGYGGGDDAYISIL